MKEQKQDPSSNGAMAQTKKVAIANFGPHGSLEQVIAGFKSALADKGFTEGRNVAYDYSHCNFDPSLLPSWSHVSGSNGAQEHAGCWRPATSQTGSTLVPVQVAFVKASQSQFSSVVTNPDKSATS